MTGGVFRTTIKVDTAKALVKLKTQFVTPELVGQVQREVVDAEIKRSITRGVSPVRGFGRFGEYLDPVKYPGKGKKRQKPSRPVNLTLTGEMLTWLLATKKNASAIFVGIAAAAPKFVKTKALANNLGTVTKDGTGAVPRRRFIPQGDEQWNVTVTRKIKDLFAKRLEKLFNK